MPIYDYVCEEDGTFEAINSVELSGSSECPECHKQCVKAIVQGTNPYAAKTKYILPPLARREFGSDRILPPKRRKWV